MSGRDERVVYVVFAKMGGPGSVKTRLSPALTSRQAAAVHAEMLDTTVRRVGSLAAAARILAVSPDEARARAARRWAGFDEVLGQGAGDLGERIGRVVAVVHERYRRPMLLLGTDAPDLPLERCERAARIVTRGGWALCPARDGGYCLLGLSGPELRLFEGIAWGTSHVARQTRAAARRAGLELSELERWEDVDTAEDLRRLLGRLAQSEDEHLQRLQARLVWAKLALGEPGAQVAMANEEVEPSSGCVLIADDNPQILELLEAYLEPLGVRVRTALDGQATLAAVERERPDLILLDIMMPKRSGYEVCRMLKDDPRFRDIPIVMVTALNERGDEERARESGADDFLSKPVNKLELLERVRGLLR